MGEPSGEGPGGTRSLRHAIRTHLNHLVGYAEVLRDKAVADGPEGLARDYRDIARDGLALRDVILPCFRPREEGVLEPGEIAERQREAYALLFDIIARIQETKRLMEDNPRFVLETESMLGGANAVLDILEEGLGASPGTEEARPPEFFEEHEVSSALRSARVLVVDDDQINRELLARHLERQGHVVCLASDGLEALRLLREAPFDILIMDVMMPGMNGYQLLERLKSDERLSSIYVIVISALDDTQSIARCIQLGAEDYLPREFEPVVLKARIESCMEKKSLKEKEALYIAAVRETERRLRAELHEGAAYVRSLLPRRLDLPEFATDWLFIPSLSLGGDVFGYHPVGGPRSSLVALYLIDVSGHGIEAALFSVSLMNLLKSQSLAGADFRDPASVLRRLNESFRMEEQNNLYFTAWYGVWDKASRELVYASAGSPPALLVPPAGESLALGTGGMIVGVDDAAEYRNERLQLPPEAKLYLFSDGAFEVRLREGGVLGLEAFMVALSAAARSGVQPLLAPFAEELRGLSASGRFEDDVSLVEFRFK